MRVTCGASRCSCPQARRTGLTWQRAGLKRGVAGALRAAAALPGAHAAVRPFTSLAAHPPTNHPPPGVVAEYKYVLLAPDGRSVLAWQGGANNLLAVRLSEEKVEALDSWRAGAGEGGGPRWAAPRWRR